jgi:hypothetical protein
MCAQQIQSAFRGYVTRKYHFIACKRMKQFQIKLGGAVAGWKTRKVMSCVKVQEGMRAIKIKWMEVIKE